MLVDCCCLPIHSKKLRSRLSHTLFCSKISEQFFILIIHLYHLRTPVSFFSSTHWKHCFFFCILGRSISLVVAPQSIFSSICTACFNCTLCFCFAVRYTIYVPSRVGERYNNDTKSIYMSISLYFISI